MISKGEQWIDPDFPLEYNTLINYDLDHEAEGTNYSKCYWRRASEIFKTPCIFQEGLKGQISPDQIKQGGLNNS